MLVFVSCGVFPNSGGQVTGSFANVSGITCRNRIGIPPYVNSIESGIGSLNEKKFLVWKEVKFIRMLMSMQKRLMIFASLRCVCRE